MDHSIDFGDRVVIRESPETARLGIAGQQGTVYGFTTPSVTQIPVVGNAAANAAIAVQVESASDVFWLALDLIEFVDHAAGTTIQVAGIELVRQADGEWIKSRADTPQPGFVIRLLRKFLKGG